MDSRSITKINNVEKRESHKIDPNELELQQMEFKQIMGNSWGNLDLLIGNIFCTCDSKEKKLVNYRIFLNDLDDLILKGYCSGCGSIAARYIETGEKEESRVTAKRIRKMNKASG